MCSLHYGLDYNIFFVVMTNVDRFHRFIFQASHNLDQPDDKLTLCRLLQPSAAINTMQTRGNYVERVRESAQTRITVEK